MADQQPVDYQNGLDAINKLFREHLGPQLAASSLNIPHPGLFADITAINTALATIQAQITALQSQANTAGRYM